MKKMYLYHICREGDVGSLSQGYIGISTNVERRWKEHKAGRTNKHLKNALDKYDDVQFMIITEGNKDEILRMEEWLRPEENMGWNIAKGGGVPPNHTGEGHPYFGKQRDPLIIEAMRQANLGRESIWKGMEGRWTDEQRAKIGKAHKGKVLSEEHKEKIRKKVDQLTLDGEYIATHMSATEAALSVGLKPSSVSAISRVCVGKNKSAGGFKWRFA